MEGKKSGTLDPDFGRGPGGRDAAAPQVGAGGRATRSTAAGGALRRRRRRRDLHAAVPRLARRQGHRRSTTSPATSTRPRCSATSGSSGPTSRSARPTPSSRSASAPRCAPQLDEAKAEGWLVPAVVVGLLPGQRRRQRPRRLDRRRPPHRAAAVHVPAPARATATSASPTSSARSSQRRRRLRRVPRGDRRRARQRARARAVRRRPLPGVPAHPRPLGRDDRGARRALAPPHPRGVGLRRRGRPDARRPVPPAVPRLALLVGLPGVPRPRRPGEARRPARARTASA